MRLGIGVCFVLAACSGDKDPDPDTETVADTDTDSDTDTDADSDADTDTDSDADTDTDTDTAIGPSAADQGIQEATLPYKYAFETFDDVEFGNGVFVVQGPEARYVSADGLTWQRTGQAAAITPFLDVVFDGTQFISHGGNMEVSTDGVTWTQISSNQCELQCLTMKEFVGNGTDYVGVGQDVFTSGDLDTWGVVDVGRGLEHVGGDGSMVLITKDAEAALSTDGGASFGPFVDVGDDIYDVLWSGTEWVLPTNSGIMTSPDGTTWTNRTARSGYGVATDGARWAVASQGYFFLGDSLEALAAPKGNISDTWNDVAFGNGFVVIAGNGILSGNPDLTP